MWRYVNALFTFRQLLKRAHWDEHKLRKFQEEKLRSMVNYAYENVPYYNTLFKNMGLSPDQIKSLDDLNKIPILTKEEIIANPQLFISKEYKDVPLRSHSTSGSTGKPLVVYIHESEDLLRKIKHLRANFSCGHKPRDKWGAITSPSHFGDVSKFQQKLGIFSPIFVSVFEDPAQQLRELQGIQPSVIGGYSSSLLLLAKEAKSIGSHELSPRIMFGGAELIDDVSRKFIEDTFSAPLYDQYAIIELERIAWQCPEKIGYHLDSDLIITQFLDPNLEEVAGNESGQIVCTSLFNFAMPLLRYVVGDIGVPSDEVCPCGRSLPLMKGIEGRKDSLILLPDGRHLSPRTMTITMNQFDLRKNIDQFRIIQKTKNKFLVYLKLREFKGSKSDMVDKLDAHFKKMLSLNSSIDFKVEFVEDMPLDKTGKFRLVHSEVNS